MLFVAEAVYFARAQNIWIDETTQLSGATLGLRSLLEWLAGADPSRFGVPGDRMPPVSYLIDSACWLTVCGSPFSFRLLHIAIAAVGVVAVMQLVARRCGTPAAAALGLFLVLSPRLVETAVEIRAYPVFFTLTCLQLRLFVSLIERDNWEAAPIAGFFLLGLAAIFTHFFALVSTMAMVAALLACRGWSVGKAAAVILLGLGLLACAAGLLPFISGAAQISGGERAATNLSSLIAFLPRAIAHPANMVEPAAALLYFVPLLVLLALAAGRVCYRLMSDWRGAVREPITGVAMALTVGTGVTLAAALLASGFNPLKPSYSIWMLPFVGLLVAAAVRTPRSWVAIVILPLLGGAAWADGIFLANRQWFAHGPEHAIRDAIGSQPTSTAVAYVGDNWAFGYFPIWYAYHGAVSQWLVDGSGLVHAIGKGGAVDARGLPPAVLGRARKVVLVDIQLRGYETFRARTTSSDSISSKARLPGMTLASEYTQPGLYSAQIGIFRNTR